MMSDIEKIILMILAALVAKLLIVFANDRLKHGLLGRRRIKPAQPVRLAAPGDDLEE